MINFERAWVFVDLPRLQRETFAFCLRNYGRSAARVAEVKQTEIVIPMSEAPDIDSELQSDSFREFSTPATLAPGERWERSDGRVLVAELLPEAMRVEVRESRQRFWLFGRIEYTDLVTSTEHQTRFCFSYDPSSDRLVPDGPAGGNCCT